MQPYPAGGMMAPASPSPSPAPAASEPTSYYGPGGAVPVGGYMSNAHSQQWIPARY